MMTLLVDHLDFTSEISWAAGIPYEVSVIESLTGRIWRGSKITLDEAVQLVGRIILDQRTLALHLTGPEPLTVDVALDPVNVAPMSGREDGQS